MVQLPIVGHLKCHLYFDQSHETAAGQHILAKACCTKTHYSHTHNKHNLLSMNVLILSEWVQHPVHQQNKTKNSLHILAHGSSLRQHQAWLMREKRDIGQQNSNNLIKQTAAIFSPGAPEFVFESDCACMSGGQNKYHLSSILDLSVWRSGGCRWDRQED